MISCNLPVCPASFIHPAHPRIVDAIPLGAGWIYEARPRGERVQIHTTGGLRVFDRYGGRVTATSQALSAFAVALPDLIAEAWLLVGRQAPRAILTDLLCMDGRSTLSLGYRRRRELLEHRLGELRDPLGQAFRMSEILYGHAAMRPPPEFIWARREHGAHHSGRSLTWVEQRAV